MDKPNRQYQTYLSALAQWRTRQTALEGDPQKPATDTLHWLEQELDAIQNSLPKEMARVTRLAASKGVFAKKKSLVKFYEKVKESIDQEIGKYGTDLRSYNISIEAHLRSNRSKEVFTARTKERQQCSRIAALIGLEQLLIGLGRPARLKLHTA